MQYAIYLRMNVAGMRPNELWATAIEDVELAEAVQKKWHEGVYDAKDEHAVKGSA